MTYYLDSNYHVYVDQDESRSRTPWEDVDGFFDGKARAYIEGYRVVPAGVKWEREDGEEFEGLMISPALDFEKLRQYQSGYVEAHAELATMIASLSNS